MESVFQKRLRERRLEVGMSMPDLQFAYNGKRYRTFIFKLEHGIRRPGLDVVERLAKCLTCSPCWLAGWSNTKEATR